MLAIDCWHRSICFENGWPLAACVFGTSGIVSLTISKRHQIRWHLAAVVQRLCKPRASLALNVLCPAASALVLCIPSPVTTTRHAVFASFLLAERCTSRHLIPAASDHLRRSGDPQQSAEWCPLGFFRPVTAYTISYRGLSAASLPESLGPMV